uniref:Uncharacterized protein n=1 Tax=Candidatus Kentrum sp. TUN TaxID=2126343 RepID=A0A450ZZW0_9GAMM|nr:MAG: hypothetical protein BECKTUN1418D_GA0071000_109913 [Candidatus Kentron sp. TUN]
MIIAARERGSIIITSRNRNLPWEEKDYLRDIGENRGKVDDSVVVHPKAASHPCLASYIVDISSVIPDQLLTFTDLLKNVSSEATPQTFDACSISTTRLKLDLQSRAGKNISALRAETERGLVLPHAG